MVSLPGFNTLSCPDKVTSWPCDLVSSHVKQRYWYSLSLNTQQLLDLKAKSQSLKILSKTRAIVSTPDSSGTRGVVIFNVQKELYVEYAMQPAPFACPLQLALTVWVVCRNSPCVRISCEASVPAPRGLLSGQQPAGWAESASLTPSHGTRDVTLSCGHCFSWGGSKRERGHHVASCTSGKCRYYVGSTVLPLWRRRGGMKWVCRNQVKLSDLT